MSSSTSPNSHWENRFRLWSIILRGVVFAVGVLVLIGWQFDIELLKRISPKFVAMNPMSAVGFLLAATSLQLRGREKNSVTRFLSQVAAAGVLLIGLIKILEYATGWQSNFDS